jgi:hypothetical protein
MLYFFDSISERKFVKCSSLFALSLLHSIAANLLSSDSILIELSLLVKNTTCEQLDIL